MTSCRARRVITGLLTATAFAVAPGAASAAPDGGQPRGGADAGGPRPHRWHGWPDGGVPGLDGGVVRSGGGHSPQKGPKPRPMSDEERAASLYKKRSYDQACPIYERLTKTRPQQASLWEELGQCELRRGHRKAAITAAARAAQLGDRPTREAAYGTLRIAGEKFALPVSGCEWLPESPGGVCDEQMWGCGYEWESPTPNGKVSGHAVTFGNSDDERDVLDSALRDGTALRPQLAAEWKALVDARADEQSCSGCPEKAVESAGALVNARATECFRRKTGRIPQPEVCALPDSDCELYTACLDAASALARRVDTEHNRALWPEAADVIAAAHKVCDATCGVVSTMRCEVVSLDACRGYVGYSCVQTQRGRRPMIHLGELSIDDGSANWMDATRSN